MGAHCARIRTRHFHSTSIKLSLFNVVRSNQIVIFQHNLFYSSTRCLVFSWQNHDKDLIKGKSVCMRAIEDAKHHFNNYRKRHIAFPIDNGQT